MAGLTFGDVKTQLATVVGNGVDANSIRVKMRADEATQIILNKLTPVNGMMTTDVTAGAEGLLVLPKEMENAIYAALVSGGTGVYGDTDINQAFLEPVSNFTYLDPSEVHDNPLIDNGLVPDPGPPANPSVLRRSYTYPGIDQGTVVRMTGDKKYLPIVDDDSYMIVQNIPALKQVIESIEMRENNAPAAEWQARRDDAIETLRQEVAKHKMDRRRFVERKRNYEQDLITYAPWTKGWVRARIALEQPGALLMGKLDLDRLLERAEMTAMEMGIYKGCLEEFVAEVFGGDVWMPARVEAVLATSLCGQPMEVRSIFSQYLKNGPANWDCSCGGYIRDQGEEVLGGVLRRKIRVPGSCEQSATFRTICKLRWVAKQPNEYMVIRNLQALQALCSSLLAQGNENWKEASDARMAAKTYLDKELEGYLEGVQHTLQIHPVGVGNRDIGSRYL